MSGTKLLAQADESRLRDVMPLIIRRWSKGRLPWIENVVICIVRVPPTSWTPPVLTAPGDEHGQRVLAARRQRVDDLGGNDVAAPGVLDVHGGRFARHRDRFLERAHRHIGVDGGGESSGDLECLRA